MVPCRGFEPRSPALRAGAFTRLAYKAKLERPAGNDPASSRWRREGVPKNAIAFLGTPSLPLSYDRVVGEGRIRTSEPRRGLIYSQAALAACILAHVGCGGRTCTDDLWRMRPASCFCSTAASNLVGLFISTTARRFIRGRARNWRKREVLIPNGSRHPSRFERAPNSCPVTFPYWRKTERTMPIRFKRTARFPAGAEPCLDSLPYWRTVEVSISTRSRVPRVFKARCRAAG